MSSKRSSSFRRAIANGRRTLQREILLDETGLGLYKRFVRYVAYEILPCETDRRWYFHQNRLCPPPVFIAVVTIIQVRFRKNSACFAVVIGVCAADPRAVFKRSTGPMSVSRSRGWIYCGFIHSVRPRWNLQSWNNWTNETRLLSHLLWRPDPWVTAHLCTEHLLATLTFAPLAGCFRFSVFCPACRGHPWAGA